VDVPSGPYTRRKVISLSPGGRPRVHGPRRGSRRSSRAPVSLLQGDSLSSSGSGPVTHVSDCAGNVAPALTAMSSRTMLVPSGLAAASAAAPDVAVPDAVAPGAGAGADSTVSSLEVEGS